MTEFDLLSDTTVGQRKEFDLLSDTVVAPRKEFDLLSDVLVLPPTAFALLSDTVVATTGHSVIKTIYLLSDTVVVDQIQIDESGGKFACPNVSKDCLPCDDDPITNYSAEDPDDLNVFCATAIKICEAPIGFVSDQPMCVARDCSFVSQDEAQFLADTEAARCCTFHVVPPHKDEEICPPDCPPTCPPICPPQCPPICPDHGGGNTRVFNTAQTCTINCPEGGTFTLTVPAGTVLGFTQAEANYLAHSLACKRARTNMICLTAATISGCKGDFLSVLIKATGRISQLPLKSEWSISGPAIDPNVLTYDFSAVFGTTQIEVFGTPTIVVDTYLIASITDHNSGFVGQRQFPVKVINCDIDWGEITPDILSSNRSYWNSGEPMPAGHYRISYVNGAWRPGPLPKWVVGDGGGTPPRGYIIEFSGGSIMYPTTGIYDSQAEAEAATVGTSITFYHDGGTIAMHLQDAPYSDNHPGSPNPTFKLEAA